MPIHGTLGNLAIAPINHEGHYSTDQAPVGEVAIRINFPRTARNGPRADFEGPSSPLRGRTTPHAESILNLSTP